MRRALILTILAAALVPGVTSAASWRHYSSKVLGFTIKYPSDWKVLQSAPSQPVSIQRSGSTVYSITVAVLPIKPSHSIAATMARTRSYEHQIGNTTFASIHWQQVRVGGKPGMAGVLRPPTEGGVPVANGIYVLASRAHVYQVTVVAFEKPAPKTLSRFPSVYRQILGSWRYL